MATNCPVCHRKFGITVRSSTVGYATSAGGGSLVCTKCAKERRDEINKHNAVWGQYSGERKKKNPNCKHEWIHPFPSRWYCPKCGAEFNVMCGCGGSAYICQKHYDGLIKEMEEIGKDNYLAEHSY